MKKRRIITVLGLSITLSLYIVACGKQESLNPTDQPDQTDQTEEVYTTDQSEPETEEITETIEEINNKMFGLDGITASEDKTSSSETSGTTRTDYPDSNPEHQKAWNNFCENWNESDYGTTTKGKVMNDFPYYGDTGYDPKGTILQYRTTDKGYTVMYDTETGRVYYTGMTLPTGDAWDDTTSGGVISQYIIDNNLTGMYDLTYAQFQELLGTYAGD